jgi:IS5 family transposase
MPLLRDFAKLDASEDAIPDETMLLKFRHPLEHHGLAEALFNDTKA